MQLDFCSDGFAMPVSQHLMSLLSMFGVENHVPATATSIVFNFRDSDYSPENGGYHPVEIRLVKTTTGWIFDYITDFSYFGVVFPELVKEIDFDFTHNYFEVLFQGRISREDAEELYLIWEKNFVQYLQTGAYSEINLSHDTEI